MKTVSITILFAFFIQLMIAQSPNNQNLPFGIHDPTVPQVDKIEDLVTVGAAWVRYPGWDGITWDMIEQQQGQYQWVRDGLYLQTYNNKIKMNVVVLAYNRNDGAAQGYLPKNMQWYLEFLAKAVERYDGDGTEDAPGSPVVDVWEIGNEEDNFWYDTPGNYALLLKESYKTIKRANPNARVAFAGLGGPVGLNSFFIPVLNELEKIKDSPDQKYFDICGFHWSGQFKGNYRTEIFPRGSFLLDSLINQMRVELAARGYIHVPIWVGEMSYNDGMPPDLAFLIKPRTEREQAVELFKRYIYSAAKGVEKIFWCTLTEWNNFGGEGVGNYFDCVGLINNPLNDGLSHKKLAYYTYKKMVEVLSGCEWNTIKTIQEKDSIYIYKLTKNDKSVWIAWNDGLTKQQVSISGISDNLIKVTNTIPKYQSGKDVIDYSSAFEVTTSVVTNNSVSLLLADIPVFIEELSISSVERNLDYLPCTFVLYQNYPNPFNPTTTIRFNLPQNSPVTLKIFDVLGREVITLIDGELNSGEHSVVFNAKDLTSGIYFCRLMTSSFHQIKLMQLLK
jgi:hypothetical protein